MNNPIPIISKFVLAFENVRFYPSTHSLLQDSLTDLHALMQEALALEKEFTFGFIEKKLMVNDQVVVGDPSQTQNLARWFETLRIGTVTFQFGLTFPELRSFMECLAMKTVQGDKAADKAVALKKALTEHAFEHVHVSEVHYARIDKIPAAPRKVLRTAVRSTAASVSTFILDGSGTMPPPAEPPPRMPSHEELKELYAIRDRFKAELDRRLHEAIRHYEIENKRLAFEKGTMDSIMRNAGEGLVVVGNDGHIIMANPAAEKLLGKHGQAIIGQKLKESLSEEHSLVIAGGIQESVMEVEVASKNEGTRRVLRSSNAVIENPDGQTIGMVSVLSDITKMKEVEQLKSDFVANVSHELRSPLAAIQKNLGLILDQTAGVINANQKEFLSLAKDNVERLTRLINNLLDLSKIEAGKMELKKARTDLKILARNAVTAFTGWFCEKGITARLDVPNTPLDLEVDADKITQVMNNLLSNALKFTPPKGEIRIALNAAAGPVEISVTDTGIGIAQKDLQRIFNKFEQVSANQPAGVKGTGLGLPLAKEIVEKHGGCMRVTSAIGRGSTFTFTLPR